MTFGPPPSGWTRSPATPEQPSRRSAVINLRPGRSPAKRGKFGGSPVIHGQSHWPNRRGSSILRPDRSISEWGSPWPTDAGRFSSSAPVPARAPGQDPREGALLPPRLRRRVRSLDTTSELGKSFLECSSKGELVPDELTIEMWRQNMHAQTVLSLYKPKVDLLVLDGIPRVSGRRRRWALHRRPPDHPPGLSRRRRMVERMKKRAIRRTGSTTRTNG